VTEVQAEPVERALLRVGELRVQQEQVLQQEV
jgi:hypothetical protein